MKTDIRAVIVEDMESYMLTIEKMVTEVAPYVTIIGKTTSLRNAKTLISDWSPNLLLMDIQFEEEGLTAFDLLSQLGRKEELSFDIIFITGHRASEYYSMAFDYGALHFLKKPVDKQKLKEAIERIHDKNTEGYINDWINQVSQLQLRLQSERFPSSKITKDGF